MARWEKQDLGRTVSDDATSGPYRSVGKTCPIIPPGLSGLLRDENGYVGYLPRGDIIEDWERRLGAFAKKHIPTRRASGNLRDTFLP